MICLLTYYGGCIILLWPYTREWCAVPDPWFRDLARMVIASIIGFMVPAMFVTLEGLELPYYVALIGASVLRLASTMAGDAEGMSPRPVGSRARGPA